MIALHALVPEGYDDPARVSGGNTYDRRALSGLTELGWDVVAHPIANGWPVPQAGLDVAIATALRAIPDGAFTLVDGLLTGAAGPLLRQADRLRLVVLAHMADPPGGPHPAVADRAELIVTTSAWTAGRLVDRLGVSSQQLVVDEPGVDPAEPSEASPQGERLLCVAAITPDKGHDVLVEALAAVRDRGWTCVCAGSLDRDPAYVERLRGLIEDRDLTGRLRLVGRLDGPGMAAAYAGADLLVHPSRSESYGLVVTEALARALPVIATDVGGVAEALGRTADGHRPGVLVPVDDPSALAGAVAHWLADPTHRLEVRARAAERRESLARWSETSRILAHALTSLNPR